MKRKRLERIDRKQICAKLEEAALNDLLWFQDWVDNRIERRTRCQEKN